MNTISYRRIREFIFLHPDAESPLNAWYKIAKKASWKNLVEVRIDYPHADLVGGFIVFNIAGNKFRPISEIHFEANLLLIRHVLTHAEYDKDKWKV
jgi:mRNA interferase HigB